MLVKPTLVKPMTSIFYRSLRLAGWLAIVGGVVVGSMSAPAWGQNPDLLKYTPLPETSAAPDVAKELRQRVTEFFQLSQDKSFRKALSYVADDTADRYLEQGKLDIKKFDITDLHFAADFKRAAVRLDVARTWAFDTDVLVVTLPMSTSWKIEDGKWMFFEDASLQQKNPVTGMFATPTDLPKEERLAQQDADGKIKLPENFGDPNKMAEAARAILSKGALDKNMAKLAQDRPSEDKVVFHNAQQGYIDLELGGIPPIPGLSVTIDKRQLGPNEDAIVLLKYTPPAKIVDGPPAQAPYTFDAKVVMQPFERVFPIRVMFEQ